MTPIENFDKIDTRALALFGTFAAMSGHRDELGEGESKLHAVAEESVDLAEDALVQHLIVMGFRQHLDLEGERLKMTHEEAMQHYRNILVNSAK